MVRIVLSGCSGYMGRVVSEIAAGDGDAGIVAGLDLRAGGTAGYPIFTSMAELRESFDKGEFEVDVIVDFSSPQALKDLLYLSTEKRIPLVLCTTGYSHDQLAAIEVASNKVAVFRSGNMSVGINLLLDLVKRAADTLGGDFDVEIVERHHRRKLDAPSGTALMLAEAAGEGLPYEPGLVFERESVRAARGAHDIGISAVRGGTIVGVHEVIFAGHDEVIELRHSAASRGVFAAGAIRAAKFMQNMPPGLYNMKDVLAKKQ